MNSITEPLQKIKRIRKAKNQKKIAQKNQRDPDGFTFHEREDLLTQLSVLTDRGDRDLRSWRYDIEATLRRHRSLSALAKLLPDLGEAASQGGSPANEAKVAALVEENHEILGAAMRIVEAQPVTALGYAVRSRIREAVTEDVWSSAPVKIMRWAAPFLFVVFFGGTLFYSYRFEGLVNLATQTANQAVADIKSNANQVHTLTTEAESQVNSVKEQSNSANKTLTDMQTRLGQVGSDLSARSGEVDSLKTKIKEQEGRIDRLQKTIGETQEIVDAREQFARAIRQVSPQMGEQTWAMVLKIALYEDIVMLIAAAFTIIWFFNFMYSHFKK